MRHIDDGQLHAFLDGALHTDQPAHASEIESHLATCGACQARLEQERSVRDSAQSILEMAAPVRRGHPSFDQLIGRTGSAALRQPSRLRAVPLAWAASVVLAVGLGWLAHASLREPAEPTAEAHVSLTRAPEPAPASEPPASVKGDPVSVEIAARPAKRQPARATPATSALPAPAASSFPEVLADEKPAAEMPAAETRTAAPLLAASAAPAESTEVHGQVTDEDGRPLAGVQVHVRALAARTVTGQNGAYALSLPAERLSGEDTLTITAVMVGRETEQRPLAIRPGQVRAQDFRLRAASLALDALVVAAAANIKPRWVKVDRATAEQALGRRIRTVPDLPVLGFELGRSGDSPVVRVRQRIGRTGTLLLEQTPEPISGSVEPGAAGAAEHGARELSSIQRRGETELVVQLTGLRVTARGRAPVDSLRAWLKRLQ